MPASCSATCPPAPASPGFTAARGPLAARLSHNLSHGSEIGLAGQKESSVFDAGSALVAQWIAQRFPKAAIFLLVSRSGGIPAWARWPSVRSRAS